MRIIAVFRVTAKEMSTVATAYLSSDSQNTPDLIANSPVNEIAVKSINSPILGSIHTEIESMTGEDIVRPREDNNLVEKEFQPDPKLQYLHTYLLSEFEKNGFVHTQDPITTSEHMNVMMADMRDDVKARFQSSVMSISSHVLDETVASISFLNSGKTLIIRFRNPQLSKLVPVGHQVIDTILRESYSENSPPLILTACEIREKGHNEGFLFGSWRHEEGFFRYLFSEKKVFHFFITALFLGSLMLISVITLQGWDNRMADLGLRLGPPILVSTSVLMLERLASWVSNRDARLRWSPTPARSKFDGPEVAIDSALSRMTEKAVASR